MPAQYAPEYRVTINGNPLPPAARGCVTRVTHQDGFNAADRVELTLANPNQRWLDDPLFRLDNPLALSLGYAPGPLEEVFVGEITGLTPSFPAGGMPTLTVVAHDRVQRLTGGTHDLAFDVNIPGVAKFPLPDPLVAGLVAASNLLVPTIDPVGGALAFLTLMLAYAIEPIEGQNAIRAQRKESDFDFLIRVARQNGWEMGIDHTAAPRGHVLRFRSLFSDFAPTAALQWGRSLIEFNPRLTTVGQLTSVAARFLVSAIKTEFVVVLGWDYDRAAFDFQVYPRLGLSEELLKKPGGKMKLLTAGGAARLPSLLISTLIPVLNGRLTGTGTAVGDTRLKSGAVVSLDGLGGEFGGLYRITSATNTIDAGGFRTAFEVRKEVWFGSVPVPKGVGGLVRVQGERVG